MKSHFFKKIVSIFLCFVFTVYTLSMSVCSAYISVPYWYCDTSNCINIWENLPTDVYVYTFAGMPSHFTGAMISAITRWSNSLGINMSYHTSTTQSQASPDDIKFFGGTNAQITTLSFWRYSVSGNTGLAGRVEPDADEATPDTYIAAGIERESYIMERATGFVIKLENIDSSYGYNHYNNVCTHEMGHALGWYGHINTKGYVMYHNNDGVQTNFSLTYRDIDHIKQFYN